MSNEKKNLLSEIMSLAWQMVKRNGYTMSKALKTAWANIKLRAAMKQRIVKFYYRKIDGSVREAYGTLKENLLPPNCTLQTYFYTEHQGWRCFKIANLVKIG